MNTQVQAEGKAESSTVEVYYHTRVAAEFHMALYTKVTMTPNQETVTNLTKLGLYEKAAVVEIPQGVDPMEALEIAYEKTQNIHDSWTKNTGVTAITETPRSSMMGDVFVISGKPFAVAAFGFTTLDSFDPSPEAPKKPARPRTNRDDEGPSF